MTFSSPVEVHLMQVLITWAHTIFPTEPLSHQGSHCTVRKTVIYGRGVKLTQCYLFATPGWVLNMGASHRLDLDLPLPMG